MNDSMDANQSMYFRSYETAHIRKRTSTDKTLITNELLMICTESVSCDMKDIETRNFEVWTNIVHNMNKFGSKRIYASLVSKKFRVYTPSNSVINF